MCTAFGFRCLLLVLAAASVLACTQSAVSPLTTTGPTALPGPGTRARIESLDVIQERASCSTPLDPTRPCDTVALNPDGSVTVPPGAHRLRVVWANPRAAGRTVVLTISADWPGSMLNTMALGTAQENTIAETSPEDAFSVIPGVPGRSVFSFQLPAGVPLGRLTADLVETGTDLPTPTRERRDIVILAR